MYDDRKSILSLQDSMKSADFEQKPEVKAQPELPVKLTKAERRAQHQQLQKELWDTAENPNRSFFLESQGVVPLKQEPKTAVKVLSRKPTPAIAKRDPANGIGGLSLDDEDDSEEEARKKREASFEERQKRAKLEREEKQRKYAEARERIMGSSNTASPAPNSRESSQGRSNRQTKQRANGPTTSQPPSGTQSPVRIAAPGTQLFDPEDMSRRLPQRVSTPKVLKEGEPIRQPRAPDSSGRGGFGFSPRGDLSGT